MDILATSQISIIIPAYCHELYIGTAIQSVLAQTYTNFELIIIDDASIDGTWQVIQSFKDSRIKAFRHDTNQGAVVTINEGLRLAKGQYLTILNSDDIYHPERLQRLMDVVSKDRAEFIFTDVELVDGLGIVIQDHEHGWLKWFDGLKNLYKQTGDVFLALLSGNMAVSTSNMFFSADVLTRIGYFHEYRYAHDYDFILRYMAAPGAELRFLDGEKLMSYRLHGSNTITESTLATAQEVFGLLARWLAELAPVLARDQLAAIAQQLVLHERTIETEMNRSVRKFSTEAQALRNSYSFKLGQLLFVPVRAIMRAFRLSETRS